MHKYQNATQIDIGGQATVYLADDVQDQRKVIIKTAKHDNPGNRPWRDSHGRFRSGMFS